MEQFLLIQEALSIIWNILSFYWWLYLPILFFFAWLVSLETHNRLKHLASLEWVLLEIRVPREPHKSPKAMEQVFAGLHGVGGTAKPRERIFKGKIGDWFSFELAGTAGEIHFYIRTQKQYKNLVESQIYAQYPDAELVEAEDYLSALPAFLPNSEYDLWCGELVLTKEDAYPIRTYPEFEEKTSGKEEVKRIDPMASLAEILSTLEAREYIGIQLLFKSLSDDQTKEWLKKGQAVIDKLMGKKSKKEEDLLAKVVFGIDEFLPGGAPAKKEDRKEYEPLSPGKQDILKAVEKSFAKVGFQCGIRIIYVAPVDNFHKSHIAALNGAFKQFASPSMNGFKPNKNTIPPIKGLLKKQKAFRIKSIIYKKFRERLFVKKPFIFNTEELATVYHFPDVSVRAPLLPRVEAKKGEPPAGLPIG